MLIFQMNNHYELSNIHKNHHGFHYTSVKKWGATWRVRLSARGPGWPFGAVLSPLYTEQRRGPRPHCLSDNWEVKPFTESSGEASKLKDKKRKKRGGGEEEKKYWRTRGTKGLVEEESTTQTLRTMWFSSLCQTDKAQSWHKCQKWNMISWNCLSVVSHLVSVH